MDRIESLFNTAANLTWGLFAKNPSDEAKRNAKIVAHRGVFENGLAVENSRDAFRLAIENKIWGIEFDVRWTKDDVPVIHHDVDCRRIYNCNRVISDSTFAELKKDVPDILTLEEVIIQYAQKIVLMIELKESLRGQSVRSDRLEKFLSRLIPRKHFYLLAIDPQILESVAFVSKKAMMSVALRNVNAAVKQTLNFGYGNISGPFMLLTQKHLNLCRKNGIAVGTGFIESRGAFYTELNRGVDLIFTNHPLRLKSYL